MWWYWLYENHIATDRYVQGQKASRNLSFVFYRVGSVEFRLGQQYDAEFYRALSYSTPILWFNPTIWWEFINSSQLKIYL